VRGTAHHEEDDDVNAALTLAAEAAEATEHANPLPFDPAALGVGGFIGLVVLLAITYAFRSIGQRH
jgi:hypothetical protein